MSRYRCPISLWALLFVLAFGLAGQMWHQHAFAQNDKDCTACLLFASTIAFLPALFTLMLAPIQPELNPLYTPLFPFIIVLSPFAARAPPVALPS